MQQRPCWQDSTAHALVVAERPSDKSLSHGFVQPAGMSRACKGSLTSLEKSRCGQESV